METLKGVKDFLPEEQKEREKVINLLVQTFKNYGFEPIETSILELYEVASAKYSGDDEILNEVYTLKDRGERKLVLRYELTFKLAKLFAQNKSIPTPFKRYEIGKVFRDGPVKTGRLREFTQCDIDIIGVKSQAADAEIVTLAIDFFSKLGIDIIVKLNSRKVLFDIFSYCGIEKQNFIDAAISIDKLDKIGMNGVKSELKQKISEENVEKLFEVLDDIEGQPSNSDKIKKLEKYCSNDTTTELKEFFAYSKMFGSESKIVLSPYLARGLGYYTGTIWEVYNPEFSVSLAAGGRWDNLISKYINASEEYPATGMSFGLDAITALLEKKGIKLADKAEKIVYIIPIDEESEKFSIAAATELRKSNIPTSILFKKKIAKALEYVGKKKSKFCIIIGKKETEQNKIKLRDMENGKEELFDLKSAVDFLKKELNADGQ